MAPKTQLWEVKLFTNITAEPCPVSLTGPKGARDEAKKICANILPGYALAACLVLLPGKSRPIFPKGPRSQPSQGGHREHHPHRRTLRRLSPRRDARRYTASHSISSGSACPRRTLQ